MSPDRPKPAAPSPPRRRRRLYESTGDAAPPESAPVVAEPPGPSLTDPAEAPATIGKQAEAARIVNKYVWWTTGLGYIPIPFVGVASVLAAQLKMLKDLSDLYGVPFSRNRGKALIATFGGGLGAIELSRPLLAPLLALVFPAGWPVVMSAASTAAGASTYAIGRVFTHHFELGGTLLNFRPEETRAFFAGHQHGGPSDGPPKPPDARDAPAKPGRPSE